MTSYCSCFPMFFFVVGLCQVTSWLESSLFQALVRSVWGRASGIAKSIPQRIWKSHHGKFHLRMRRMRNPKVMKERVLNLKVRILVALAINLSFSHFCSSNTSVRLNTQRIPKSPQSENLQRVSKRYCSLPQTNIIRPWKFTIWKMILSFSSNFGLFFTGAKTLPFEDILPWHPIIHRRHLQVTDKICIPG